MKQYQLRTDGHVLRYGASVGFMERNRDGHWIVWDRFHQYVSTEEFQGEAFAKLETWLLDG